MKYYISDLHLFHDNILRICNRPFADMKEMIAEITYRWNKTVGPKDEVYILGDMFFKYQSIQDCYDIMANLNGTKYIIRGNHDKALQDRKLQSYFEWVKDIAEIEDNGRRVILCHYPMEDWNGRFRGSYHLYGHIHDNWYAIKNASDKRFNVSAEVLDYTPQTLDQLIQLNLDQRYAGRN